MGFLAPLSPTFDAALRDVRAKGREFRLSAAVVLGEPERGREDEAAAALGLLARDDAHEVRAAAIDSIGRLGRSELLDLVLGAIRDRSPVVREMAMAAAAAIGGERAQDAVRDGLRSEHPEVRFQALCALARAPLPDLEPAVARLLRDDDDEVASEAATTLAAMGATAFGGSLVERIEHGSARVRDAAALALAHLGDARAVPHLRRMVRERRAPFDAVLALGELGAREAADDVAQAGAGIFAPPFRRAGAGAALLALGDDRGIAYLRSALRAWRTDARSFAVEQVGRHRAAALLSELVRIAARPRGVDRDVLVEALRPFAEDHAEARRALERLTTGARAEETRS